MRSLELIQSSTKIYETPIIRATSVNVKGRDAVAFELDVPLDKLKAGQYLCQVNVIDDAAGSFDFPRFAILVRPPDAGASTQRASTEPAAGGGAY